MSRFVGCVFLCLLLSLLVFPASVACAETPHKHHHVAKPPEQPAPPKQLIPLLPAVVMHYDIYVGGIHIVEADILFQEEIGHYRTRVNAHTYGVWYKLLPWDTVLESSGGISVDHFTPTEFYTRDQWGHKPKITKIHFDKNGYPAAEFDPPSDDANREPVSAEEKRNSLDPVAALLQMLAHVAITKNCDVKVPVFDGHRRFDLTGVDGSDEYIDEKDYGVYKGQARLCKASFTMISGAFKEGVEKDRFWQRSDKKAGRDPFAIYLASVSPDLPDLPVRLESRSVWGWIMMHLSSWRYATAEDLK